MTSNLITYTRRAASATRRASSSAFMHIVSVFAYVGLLASLLTSCIEPPLKLPAEEVMVEMPAVLTEVKLDVVWNVNVNWATDWHYPWDETDDELFGKIEYPVPSSYEVRRYFVGDTPREPHTPEGTDGFTIYTNKFRRTYQFGYYDLLLWSNIDSKDLTQVVDIREDDLNEVTATTTITRSLKLNSRADEEDRPTALYNQPEIFYSAYKQDIHISHNFEDYDYFDEEEKIWVMEINMMPKPLVFIYLVQVIIYNNEDGSIKSINGDCAMSAMANTTNVNTGHTGNNPCMVYFNTRMKKGIDVKGRRADIIGGKLTTYGLCDMEGYLIGSRAQYVGSRGDLPNYLYVEYNMSGGTVQTVRYDVTDQCQAQCHGGIITIEIDAHDVPNPAGSPGAGSLFNPTVEDYDELIYDIPM